MRSFLCAVMVVLCTLDATPLSAATAGARPRLSYEDGRDAPLAGALVLSEAPLRSLTGGSLSPPGTAYVDGISDQSLPYWDGSFDEGRFAGFFRDVWIAGPSSHISLARYVVQWNAMSGAYPNYLAQLESWYGYVLNLGLTPEISLAAYDGVLPDSSPEYRAALRALLDRFPATAYVEAWDEPNDTPGLPADTAARYTNAAQSLCKDRGCTVIAGNFLDSSSMTAYEREYARALRRPASLANWGIHPYLAVKARNAATVLAFRSNLPDAGVGERIWFTEVGAYRCEGGAQPELLGERTQARDAAWLVNRLMPVIQPAHVFYYEFLFKDRRPPPCDRSDSDTALYAPVGDLSAVDVARAAASYIYDDRGNPLP